MDELQTLEKSLIDIIVDFDEEDQDELEYFAQNINTAGLNLSELYIAAVYHDKNDFAKIILDTGKYNIKQDKNLRKEFFTWESTFRDDCMIKCLEDGFEPDVWTTQEIMDLLITNRNNISNSKIFGKLFLILRAYKIKRLLKNIRSKRKTT